MNSVNKIIRIYISIFIIFYLSIYSVFAEGDINISADRMKIDNNGEVISADGNVLIESDNLKIISDKVEYNKKLKQFKAVDNIKIEDNLHNVYYSNFLEANDTFSDASAKNIKIRLKDNSRIVGSKFIRKDKLNVIKDGQYTPCIESGYFIDNCPGWKLKAKTVFHDEATKTMHYDHSVLHILNIPVLYSPYFSHPDPSVNKRSGFLAPKFQADDKLGQIIGIPYFYNISGNKDLTFTPTVQSRANNYLTTEYRLLNKSGIFNIEANIDDNSDNSGTDHFVLAKAKLNSPLSQFEVYAQTANNDTYMRKNQINELDVLISGLTISDSYKGNDFLFEAKSYKHLSISDQNQWEYLYPKFSYNISDFSYSPFKGNINIKNEILRLKSLNKTLTTSISTEANFDNQNINYETGLVFKNFFDARAIYHSIKTEELGNDTNQIRIFPQIGSEISYPLRKTKKNISQILRPTLMPIVAPYNNYTDAIEINNSNIFSRNRSTSLSEWESGPRINYGAEWFIDYMDKYDGILILGQSLKFNKDENDISEEISDYMTSLFINLDKNIYTNAEFIFDRKELNINKSNITSSIDYRKFLIKGEFDYVSDKFSEASKQLGFGSKIKLNNSLNFIFSGKRNLVSDKNIGYETGLFYENDCLAINFKYYRDLTKFKDIEDTKGLSFSITLKPFGSSKSFGKSKTFGPIIQ